MKLIKQANMFVVCTDLLRGNSIISLSHQRLDSYICIKQVSKV